MKGIRRNKRYRIPTDEECLRVAEAMGRTEREEFRQLIRETREGVDRTIAARLNQFDDAAASQEETPQPGQGQHNAYSREV